MVTYSLLPHPFGEVILKPATTYNLVLGQVVQHHRKAKALKQEDLAEALGLTQSGYSRLERGVTTFTVTQLLKVANVFGVQVTRLVEETEAAGKTLGGKGVQVFVGACSAGQAHQWLWVSTDVLAHVVSTNQKRGTKRGAQ